MKEYESRKEAENDPNLNLRYIWECDECLSEITESPNCDMSYGCPCGGNLHKVGEVYD